MLLIKSYLIRNISLGYCGRNRMEYNINKKINCVFEFGLRCFVNVDNIQYKS